MIASNVLNVVPADLLHTVDHFAPSSRGANADPEQQAKATKRGGSRMGDQPPIGSRNSFERGLAVRRQVLGEEYVDASLSGASGFDAEFQRLITSYCWGEIWTRDGLPRKTRSLLNIAMMAALGRPHELQLHVGGARANGCTVEEIEEVILQVAVYCGIPAALDALRITRQVLEASDDE